MEPLERVALLANQGFLLAQVASIQAWGCASMTTVFFILKVVNGTTAQRLKIVYEWFEIPLEILGEI